MNKATEEERALLEQFIIPFYHADRRYPLFPGKNNKEAEAHLMGMDVQELELIRANLSENAKQAALELLKEDDVVDCLNKLPLDGSEIIGVIGDSITEDGQGWFEILKQVLIISTEKPDFKFINAGIAYNTTTDALRRLDRDLMVFKPDWVFVALGTFDAQRLNITPGRTILPLSESWENLEDIQNFVDDNVTNPIIWITPAPVISELLAQHPMYEYSINEVDLAQVRQLVAGKDGVVIDSLGGRMGSAGPEAWNYISDGLHHSLSGHMNTVRLIIKKLAQSEPVID